MSRTRLEYIDSLRGIAIAGVVLTHCTGESAGLPTWLASLGGYGGMGVELFFVLSALTLMSIYSGTKTSSRSFLTRRFFRIAPMFYLGAIFYPMLFGLGPHRFAPDGIHTHQVVLTFAFLNGWFPDSFNAVVPGGWSISAEAMFYLIFLPLLTLLTTLRRSLVAYALAVLLSRAVFVLVPRFCGHDDLIMGYASFLFPVQLVAFIGGFVCFYVCHNKTVIAYLSPNKATVLMFSVLGLLIMLAASNVASLKNYLLGDILFVPLVVAAAATRSRILLNPALEWLGRISFSVYIVHFAVLHFAKILLLPALATLPASARLAALYALVLLVSAIISDATYRYIEKRGIAFGRRLTTRPASAQLINAAGTV